MLSPGKQNLHGLKEYLKNIFKSGIYVLKIALSIHKPCETYKNILKEYQTLYTLP